VKSRHISNDMLTTLCAVDAVVVVVVQETTVLTGSSPSEGMDCCIVLVIFAFRQARCKHCSFDIIIIYYTVLNRD